MQTIDKIRELIPSLPTKDVELGLTFLTIRDFQSLKELVDSAEFKVMKARKKDETAYPEVDLENVFYLRAYVHSYCKQLEIPEQESELIWEDE